VRLFNAAPGDAERKLLIDGMNEAFAGGASGKLIAELASILAKSGNLEIALRGGDATAHAKVLEYIVNDDPAVKAQRVRWIELLGQVGKPEAVPVLLSVMEQSRWHSVRIAALAALARFDDASIGKRIVGFFGHLPLDQGVRPAAVATLISRPAWATTLLNAVRSGSIPKSEISPEQLSRLRKSDDKALVALTNEIFGPERKPTSAEKLREFERVKRIVLAAPGDVSAGKALFTARCATCHTLHGQGGKLAPDLTAYDRTNVDDILMNVVDPSAYIREEFQTFGVRTASGQSLLGVITERGANQITIADSTGRATVVPKSDIKSEKALPTSTMPEGLLGDLSDKQIQDLFTYVASKPPAGAPR
jgi:putative heme-binding domain-containing protein